MSAFARRLAVQLAGTRADAIPIDHQYEDRPRARLEGLANLVRYH
jgi:hypothetical protein